MFMWQIVAGIRERVADADLLWSHGRREGALLSILVAIAATARLACPDVHGDRRQFVAFLKTTHGWTIAVEFRGQQVDVDTLFYKWLRCQLVHEAYLPLDLKIDDSFTDPGACGVRAGGAPEFTVLISPGWYVFFRDAIGHALLSLEKAEGSDVTDD